MGKKKGLGQIAGIILFAVMIGFLFYTSTFFLGNAEDGTHELTELSETHTINCSEVPETIVVNNPKNGVFEDSEEIFYSDNNNLVSNYSVVSYPDGKFEIKDCSRTGETNIGINYTNMKETSLSGKISASKSIIATLSSNITFLGLIVVAGVFMAIIGKMS